MRKMWKVDLDTRSGQRYQRTWNPRMESLNLTGWFSIQGLRSGGSPHQTALPFLATIWHHMCFICVEEELVQGRRATDPGSSP